MIINTAHPIQWTHQTLKLPLIVYYTNLFDPMDSRVTLIDSENLPEWLL